MRVSLKLKIDFGKPVRLSDVENHRKSFPPHGVYLLVERISPRSKIDPLASSVIYIGKAVRETMFSRCRKHMWSVQDALLRTGRPRTAPGSGFRKYREIIGRDPSRLWAVPGEMCIDEPYLISCAEEFLLFKYKQRHGRLPFANTAG
jgi:hypothetical protein